MKELTNKSNTELMNELKGFRGIENKAIADIVLYLAEVDLRGIYREAGYSSLFTYCTECLGYSEGGAARRVRAARCLLTAPEVYNQLKSGQITLCSLSEVAPIVSKDNQELILSAISGVSKREAQVIAASFGAPVTKKRSVIRAKKVLLTPPVEFPKNTLTPPVAVTTAEKHYSFSFEVKEEVKELYDQAKVILGYVKPEELFETLLRDFIKRKTKEPKVIKRTSIVKARYTKITQRAIPLKTRREIFKRDQHQCSFVSTDGKRCSERLCLEVDHIKPFSLGGTHSLDNLRLLCKSHNLLQAEFTFSRNYIKSFTSGARKLKT
jgi:5-methylcytosine-specific restriction endonuclease McrA